MLRYQTRRQVSFIHLGLLLLKYYILSSFQKGTHSQGDGGEEDDGSKDTSSHRCQEEETKVDNVCIMLVVRTFTAP